MGKQTFFVSNTIVLARSNLTFRSGATVSTGNTVNFPVARYVKRIFVLFKNNVVANTINSARFSLLDNTGADYLIWFRDDLATLPYGLVESSPLVEEFRHTKINPVQAQHYYSLMFRVENDLDFLQFTFSKPGATIAYEVFIQDE